MKFSLGYHIKLGGRGHVSLDTNTETHRHTPLQREQMRLLEQSQNQVAGTTLQSTEELYLAAKRGTKWLTRYVLNGPKLTSSVDGHRREGLWDGVLQTEMNAQGNTALSSVAKGEYFHQIVLLFKTPSFQQEMVELGTVLEANHKTDL